MLNKNPHIGYTALFERLNRSASDGRPPPTQTLADLAALKTVRKDTSEIARLDWRPCNLMTCGTIRLRVLHLRDVFAVASAMQWASSGSGQ